MAETQTIREDHDRPQPAARISGRTWHWIGWVSLSFVVITAGLFHLTSRVRPWLVADADMLLLPELFEDLASGGSISDWYLPYSPYFVPDWGIYWLAVRISDKEATRLAVVAIVQVALVAAATASIARSLTGRAQHLATASATALVVLAGLHQVRPFVYLAALFFHFGTFAMVLWLIALALRFVGEPSVHRWLALSLVLSAGLALSDRIVAVWFLAPAAIAIAAWAWNNSGVQRRTSVRWIGAHIVATVAVLPLRDLVRSRESTYDLSLSLAAPWSGAKGVVDSFLDIAREGMWMQLTLVVVIVSFAVVVYRLYRGTTLLDGRPMAEDPRAFLFVFVPATAVTTIAAQIMLSGSVGPEPRYSATITMLPVLLLAAVVGLPAAPRPGVAATVAAPVMLLAATAGSTLGSFDLDREPEHIACIRAELAVTGSTQGVASYWDARELAVYLDVAMATYSPLLRGERLNVSEESYTDRYHFMVSSPNVEFWQLELDPVEALNGPPLRTSMCGEYTVWDYGPDGFDMEPFDEPSSRRWDGCSLSTQVGVLDPDRCTLTASEEAGYVMFGPYAVTPQGTYRARLRYAADGSAPVGQWDLSTTTELGDDAKIRRTGTLHGTDGDEEWLEFEWNADATPLGREEVVEIRLVTDGSASVTIHELEITRLD